MKRVLVLRKPIEEMAKDIDFRENKLENREWLIIKEVSDLLEDAMITTCVEGTKYLT